MHANKKNSSQREIQLAFKPTHYRLSEVWRFCLDLFNGYKTLPFQPEFHFREHVEIAGGQVRWVGRVGNSGHVIFLSGIPSQGARCVQAHCHGATTSLRSSTSQAICASHFPSFVSKPRSKNSYWQSGQVEQTPYAQFLDCQKKWSALTSCCCKLGAFFQLRRGRRLPLQRLLLCFQVIIAQPWFVTSYDPGQEVRIISNCFVQLGAQLNLMALLVIV